MACAQVTDHGRRSDVSPRQLPQLRDRHQHTLEDLRARRDIGRLRCAKGKIKGLRQTNDYTAARQNAKEGKVGTLYMAVKQGDTDVFVVPGCLMVNVGNDKWYVAVSGAPKAFTDEEIVRTALKSVAGVSETTPGSDVFVLG